MNFVSLFCGLGGEHAGLRRAVEKFFPTGDSHNTHQFAAYDSDSRWGESFEKNFNNQSDSVTKFHAADLAAFDTSELTERPVFVWASPPCTEFSLVRRSKISRSAAVQNLAQTVVDRWIKPFLPAGFAFENVPQFRNWGPLDAAGRPIRDRRGEYFDAFLADLSSLGYAVAVFELDAARFGCACNRRRLFVVGVRDKNGAPVAPPSVPSPPADVVDRRIADVFDPTLPMAPIDPNRRGGGGRLLEKKLELINVKKLKMIAYVPHIGFSDSVRLLLDKFTTFTRFGGYFIDPTAATFRVITPREMGAAMGFPNDFQYPASHSRALLGVGQSVAPPIAEAVAGSVFERMGELGITV